MGKGKQDDPVDLGLLFPTPGDFWCTIYTAVDERGQPFAFKQTNISSKLEPKIKDGPAHSVCFQRWTMTEFFKPIVEELWFCYMPATGMKRCNEQANEFYTQGKIFIVVFILFLGILGFIMSDMQEFETPLVWFSRLLLNLEFGMLSVGFLLERFEDTEGPAFFIAAYLIDVFAAIVLFIPYYVMEHFSEDSPFNTAYLLLLAFSPCFLMEFMSYWSHFILLVGHQPLLVGFIGFGTTALAIQYLHKVREHFGEPDEESIARRESQHSIDKASYVSVPTEEPAECCSSSGFELTRWREKLPRACV